MPAPCFLSSLKSRVRARSTAGIRFRVGPSRDQSTGPGGGLRGRGAGAGSGGEQGRGSEWNQARGSGHEQGQGSERDQAPGLRAGSRALGPSGAPPFDCPGAQITRGLPGLLWGDGEGAFSVQAPRRLGLAHPSGHRQCPSGRVISHPLTTLPVVYNLWWWASFSCVDQTQAGHSSPLLGIMPVSCAHWPTDRPTDGTLTIDSCTVAAWNSCLGGRVQG